MNLTPLVWSFVPKSTVKIVISRNTQFKLWSHEFSKIQIISEVLVKAMQREIQSQHKYHMGFTVYKTIENK